MVLCAVVFVIFGDLLLLHRPLIVVYCLNGLIDLVFWWSHPFRLNYFHPLESSLFHSVPPHLLMRSYFNFIICLHILVDSPFHGLVFLISLICLLVLPPCPGCPPGPPWTWLASHPGPPPILAACLGSCCCC